jgi:serine/threonine-protein kinase
LITKRGEAVLLRIGETIDRYKIEALIGQGGMAAVYRVRHVQLDSEHALKVLFITAPQIYQRLIREGRVQANLRHAHIVSVTDVLNISGSPALVMEYIDGPSLDTWLLENQPTLEEGLWLFRGILRGISVAHERGVVHRDLKPANVLLAPSDEGFVPKVTDFGLVKSVVEQKGSTQTGMSLGTPEYMSPEQIRDASDIDTRADMWALGCILYELVCHKRAFQGADKMATFTLICNGAYDPPRKVVPNLPRNVAEAIRSLLEVDRNNRLSSCEALYDLLYQESESKVGRIAAPARPVAPLRVDPPSVDPAPLLVRPQLLVPTGAPANRRTSMPYNYPTTPTSFQPNSSTAWRALALVLLAVLVVGGSFAAWKLSSTEAPAIPVAPGTLGMLPPPDPIPMAPPPAASEVGFAPSEAVAEAPAPEPKAIASVPPPFLADRRPSSGVYVRVIGDAKAVWLASDGKRYDATDSLAAGHYQIEADFGGGAVHAGTVELVAGKSLTLSCSSTAGTCGGL